jgi:histidinol phosphatase-like PHP family hydrolase
LEVEVDADGELTVHDDDRAWADYLLGAVHWVPGAAETPAAYARAVFDCSRQLCQGGVAVLAHPLRPYYRGRPQWQPPESLVNDLADMLAECGVAAEVNYHKNVPDRQFVQRCLDLGVPIAFGSDTHAMWQVGRFEKHLALLGELADGRDLSELLYRPPGRK